jgi:hypothetical protein
LMGSGASAPAAGGYSVLPKGAFVSHHHGGLMLHQPALTSTDGTEIRRSEKASGGWY